ncbi:proline--tRNA ligase [Cohnella fermenti]|uniref:Proline--tRNA ligase n=1 Tax=Cohnella fermenti TaxID=2565925 RepID=A0A4V3WEG4_9BACL|nr:proline--tRNA ligase [Cohnella fermenti]THF76235.1 proline--tRNA ligase [Cohnella fermenti]
MRQSTLFGSTLRDVPAEAEAASHRLLLRGGYIRQLAAGVYSYLPLGWRVLRRIERIVREELDRAGAQELLMPALQPAELWRQSGRYEAYGPELVRLRDRHDREFALGPTHEEVITSLVASEIGSYRKLPVTLYQIQTKFRDERRPRFGLLRGREFLMKDAYSFDLSEEGLERSYEAMRQAYNRILSRCGLAFKLVEADGGTIGDAGGTHEFIALASIGEDTVVSCESCDYAANLEQAQARDFPLAQTENFGTVADNDACPRCAEGKLRLTRGIEVGHVFRLGTKYSEALQARATDSSGEERTLLMGCYGIGLSRLLAAIAEQRHDERGLVWPQSLAPYHAHIIPVSAKNEVQRHIAEQLYDRLTDFGFEALLDDREERAGVKFNDSDLLGIPVRLVVGKEAEQGKVELVFRDGRGGGVYSTEEAVNRLQDYYGEGTEA